VVQKRREIGILRAMGTSRWRIATVFLVQGGLLGLVGSIVGVGLGVVLASAFEGFAVDASGRPLFPIVVSGALLIGASATAMITGVVAAVLPAARASRLDPAVAIRHE